MKNRKIIGLFNIKDSENDINIYNIKLNEENNLNSVLF